MRIKSTFVLSLLILALLPSAVPAMNLDTNHDQPSAPVFLSLSNPGTPAGSQIYENNTVITIEYRADRFDVEGVVLLGSGSNLTEEITNTDYVRNFTRVSSLRANSFYEIDLNITSYTYFYAYSWYGTFDNGTLEEFDIFGDAPGHQLWIQEGKLFPEFDISESTGEVRQGELYVPYYNNVTIEYRVRNNENTNDYVTLAIAENDTAVFSESASIQWVNMTRVNYTTIGEFEYSIFRQEINVTLPILYFTAFNDLGWERDSATTPDVHRINTGFNFTTNFSEDLDLYTNLDQIRFNITTFNATEDMTSVGYQYQVFENSSLTDEAVINWTTVGNLNNITYEFLNNTFDGEVAINSTLKQIYNATIGQSFNVSNIVEIKTFVKYGEGSNVTSEIFRIEILDPIPDLTINTLNDTKTRFDTKLISFSYSTPKGDVDVASITHTLPNDEIKTYNILSKINQTVDFTDSVNDTSVEGEHVLLFNITNSLGISETSIFVYTVDTTPPTGGLSITSPSTPVSSDGRVSISFNYDDTGISATGIQLVTIDWGNNMTLNATSLSTANMQYQRDGEFIITITIYDKVGNMFTDSVTISVDLPNTRNDSVNQGTPLSIIPIVTSLFIALPLILRKRR